MESYIVYWVDKSNNMVTSSILAYDEQNAIAHVSYIYNDFARAIRAEKGTIDWDPPFEDFLK